MRKILPLGIVLGWFLSVGNVPGATTEGLVLPIKEVTVGSPVDEIVAEVMVKEGDTVKKSQILARLVDSEEQLEVKRYEKVLAKAKFDFEAAQTLFDEKMGAKETAVDKKAEFERLKIEEQLARTRLARKTILSPIDGIVVKNFKEEGEAVQRIENLFEVVNIDRLYLQFYLEGKYINRIKTGDEISITFPELPDEERRQASVDFVDPRIDAASGLFRVKLLLENSDHQIKAGMRVNAEFF